MLEPKINTIYKTPRQLCEIISELDNINTIKLTRRPKFRFKPDECGWWLVPGTDNPHYHLAKFIFEWTDKKEKILKAGLHIEKGLDEQLKPVFSSKQASRYIMDNKWKWQNFISMLNKSLFFNEIRNNIIKNTNKLSITIDGGYVTEPTKFDPYQEKNLGWDKYVFEWNIVDNSLGINYCNRKAFVLKLHDITNIDQLSKALLKLSEDSWLWLNFYITFDLKVNNKDNSSNVEAINIWNNYLKQLGFIFL